METEDVRSAPVRYLPGEEGEPEPASGTGLCLSGGGYRAMLFHLGVLWRLDELGLLRRLDRISSVSGGSITAGVLALAWPHLDVESRGPSPGFAEHVTAPLRTLARETLDVRAGWQGLLSVVESISDRLADSYRDLLFGNAKLADLPSEPTFIINATNVGSGALVRFTRAYVADWRVGRVPDPDIDLAVAVAASSAFPPFLSPHRLNTRSMEWQTDPGNDLAVAAHRDELVLSDGGVYDNLGLETVWKRCRTVLVSDAGGKMQPDASPAGAWPTHMLRVLKVVDHQVRALRKRQVIGGLKSEARDGVYLGIRSDITHYDAEDALPAPVGHTQALAEVPTRLGALDEELQERLINWGYAICDAGARKHLRIDAAPGAFPYPQAGVG